MLVILVRMSVSLCSVFSRLFVNVVERFFELQFSLPDSVRSLSVAMGTIQGFKE